MFNRSRLARTLVALAALSLTAAACSSDDSASSTTTTSAPAVDGSSTTTAPNDGAAATVELTDAEQGQILTSDGKTLYTFVPDDAGAPTCNGDCAATWPALVADGDPTVGDGLDASLFATVTRDDGDVQVTVAGWPLYFFSGDAAPGDTNGQGLGGQWYVVGADGTAIDDD